MAFANKVLVFMISLGATARFQVSTGFTASRTSHLAFHPFGCTKDHQRTFQTTPAERERRCRLRLSGDFPEMEEDEYKGTIDWDEEWKKVVRGQGQPIERISGNPKSDLEKAAVLAQREAEATIFKMKTKAKQAVNVKSLQSDWKFWVAILAVISVVTSIISASGQSGQIYTNESYYI